MSRRLMDYESFTRRFGRPVAMTSQIEVVDGKGRDLVTSAITKKRGCGRRFVYYHHGSGQYVVERA